MSQNNIMIDNLYIDIKLLQSIFVIMSKKGLTVSVAESCTGGFLSTFLSCYSGASSFFKGSTINYTNISKIKLLGVDESIITKYGVASKPVAEQMAKNVRMIHKTDFGLSTTGYVDLYYDQDLKKCYNFYAWISVSNSKRTVSQYVSLKDNRILNIQHVTYSLVKLFRKEIL